MNKQVNLKNWCLCTFLSCKNQLPIIHSQEISILLMLIFLIYSPQFPFSFLLIKYLQILFSPRICFWSLPQSLCLITLIQSRIVATLCTTISVPLQCAWPGLVLVLSSVHWTFVLSETVSLGLFWIISRWFSNIFSWLGCLFLSI